MKIEEIKVEAPSKKFKVFDADVVSHEDYVLTSVDGVVHSPYFEVSTNKSHIFARKIGDDYLLVLEPRTSGSTKNGFIYSIDGTLVKEFFAGDGIEDAVVTSENIVISYFDEGVFGSSGPSPQGLAVFDLWGTYLYGYHETFRGKVSIADCYALCKTGQNSVLFFSYTDFPLVGLNLKQKTQEVMKTPSKVHGSHAISKFQDHVLFGGPYKDKSGIYAMNLNGMSVKKIGEARGQLKSGAGGRLIQIDFEGITILKMENIQ